ncbi:hypothetical protein [Amycolatopsis jejuensis]|uniref:hypothetical protein n=1 Tax=Amycolatopsis jejuensis TaxID=330084 RepID=UPI000B07425A|nr:hypothetical protein [Amycolatopsis jejuensis]
MFRPSLGAAWITVRLSRHITTTGGLLTAVAAIPAEIVIFVNHAADFVHPDGTSGSGFR